MFSLFHLSISSFLSFLLTPGLALQKANSESAHHLPSPSAAVSPPLDLPRSPRHLQRVDFAHCGQSQQQPPRRTHPTPSPSAKCFIPLWWISVPFHVSQSRASHQWQPLLRLPHGFSLHISVTPALSTPALLGHPVPHLHSTSRRGLPSFSTLSPPVPQPESLWGCWAWELAYWGQQAGSGVTGRGWGWNRQGWQPPQGSLQQEQ